MRREHTAIYDAVRERMVIFGGTGVTTSGSGDSVRDDTWALSLAGEPRWTLLSPSVPDSMFYPPVVGWSQHAAFYDPARDRMMVFGGGQPEDWNPEFVILSLGENPAWSTKQAYFPTDGPVLVNPRSHSVVFDAADDRMILYGGESRAGPVCPPLWTGFDDDFYTVWWEPYGRCVRFFGQSAVHDPVRDQVILFGGEYDCFQIPPAFCYSGPINSTWTFSLSDSSWRGHDVPRAPPGRSGHAAIYDPIRDRMLVQGGRAQALSPSPPGGPTWRTDTWSLSLAGDMAWTEIVTTGAPPVIVSNEWGMYDPQRDRMLIVSNGRVWALPLSGEPSWSELTSSPPPLRLVGVVYDPPRDRVIGFQLETDWRLTVWAYPLGTDGAWSEIAPGGTTPSYFGTSIYDPLRDRIVMIGPLKGACASRVVALALSGSPEWQCLEPTGPRNLASGPAVYDPVRDAMIVVSGNNAWALRWDHATPVRLPDLSVSWTGAGALIRWRVTEDGATAGFHVYREPTPGTRERLTPQLLRGRMEYSFLDLKAPPEGASYWLSEVSRDGATEWIGPVILPPLSRSHTASVSAFAPNPFSASTAASIFLPGTMRVVARVYDVQSRMVRTLVDEVRDPGSHAIRWDGKTSEGTTVAAGTYYVRISAGETRITSKVVRRG